MIRKVTTFIQLYAAVAMLLLANSVYAQQPAANPALTFVANFPPALQDATVPRPDTALDNATLHRYLPNTGSIGAMVYFYFTFWASPPYVPFVPLTGEETDLFFDDDTSNGALIELRRFISGFVERAYPDTPQVWQWERHIEL